MIDTAFKPLSRIIGPIGSDGDYLPLGVKVYEIIRKAILNGKIEPGTALFETEIADALEVSRTPVREALRLLHKERLLIRERGRGHVIAIPSAKDIREIYEIRKIIEVGGLWKAASDPSELIRDLERSVEKGYSHLKNQNLVTLRDNNNEFHAALAAQIRNERLYQWYLSVQGEISRLRLYSIQSEQWADRSLSDHKRMCALIREKALDKAAVELEKHLEDAQAALLERFG